MLLFVNVMKLSHGQSLDDMSEIYGTITYLCTNIFDIVSNKGDKHTCLQPLLGTLEFYPNSIHFSTTMKFVAHANQSDKNQIVRG